MYQDQQNDNRKSPFSRIFFKGKVYLINPSFQYKFMVNVIIVTLLSLAVIYGANQYFFSVFQQKGAALGLEANHPFYELLNEQKHFMNGIFLMVAGVVSLITGIWGLFFSHRIAGPLYRLNKIFREAGIKRERHQNSIRFRKKDFFQELPESINFYNERVETQGPTKDKEDYKKAS